MEDTHMRKPIITAAAIMLSASALAACSSNTGDMSQHDDSSGIISATLIASDITAASEIPAVQESTDAVISEAVNDDPMGAGQGHNLPLKDRSEDAKLAVEAAMKNYFDETYGDKISEANVVVKKIYNYDDEAAANLTGMNSENLAFELTYDLKPASDSKALIEELTGGNGTYNEETGWIEGKVGVGILAPNPDGTNPEYVIDLLASSF